MDLLALPPELVESHVQAALRQSPSDSGALTALRQSCRQLSDLADKLADVRALHVELDPASAPALDPGESAYLAAKLRLLKKWGSIHTVHLTVLLNEREGGGGASAEWLACAITVLGLGAERRLEHLHVEFHEAGAGASGGGGIAFAPCIVLAAAAACPRLRSLVFTAPPPVDNGVDPSPNYTTHITISGSGPAWESAWRSAPACLEAVGAHNLPDHVLGGLCPLPHRGVARLCMSNGYEGRQGVYEVEVPEGMELDAGKLAAGGRARELRSLELPPRVLNTHALLRAAPELRHLRISQPHDEPTRLALDALDRLETLRMDMCEYELHAFVPGPKNLRELVLKGGSVDGWKEVARVHAQRDTRIGVTDAVFVTHPAEMADVAELLRGPMHGRIRWTTGSTSPSAWEQHVPLMLMCGGYDSSPFWETAAHPVLRVRRLVMLGDWSKRVVQSCAGTLERLAVFMDLRCMAEWKWVLEDILEMIGEMEMAALEAVDLGASVVLCIKESSEQDEAAGWALLSALLDAAEARGVRLRVVMMAGRSDEAAATNATARLREVMPARLAELVACVA